MANFDFSTLNDRDLEELTRDLLSKKLNLNFQSFKPGPDKGVDMRYSTLNDENEIVVQVKHFIGSGTAKLKSDLKTKEVQKVISLDPKRYILCTSLALSPQDKEKIKNIFSPYIQSTADVIGKEDLNKWLDDYPDILERHFKLWLSSVNIIKKILKNGVNGRSEFFKEKILKDIKVYVPNKTHYEAVKTLNQNHFILITGAPGIGKSTLANLLTYQLLAVDFELVYVREITEAEEAFNPEKKQIFYFDDFLGAITLDLESSRNADSAIVNFVERIKNDKYKRLILTCRTTILSQAKSVSDKIQHSNIDISNYEVKIENYNDLDKAWILYNHIYISDLQNHQKQIFFQNNFHWKIIKHKYYNPRAIQDITDKDSLVDSDYSEKYVLDILDDPTKRWDKPFNIQISHISRLLLLTMYSLGGKYRITEEKLKEAFNSRIDYEVKFNNYKRIGNEYHIVLKELTGALMNRTIEKNNIYFSFFNPSIEDFIFNYFKNLPEEYLQLLKSAVFFDQFKYRITTTLNEGEKRINFSSRIIRKKLFNIFNDKKEFLDVDTYNNSSILIVSIFIRLFPKDENESEIVAKINDISISYLSWDDRENLIEILKYIAQNNLTSQVTNISKFLTALSKDIPSHYQIKIFADLIKENEVYLNFIKNAKEQADEYYKDIQKNIDISWEKSCDDYMTDTYGIDSTIDIDELEDIIKKRKEEAVQINDEIGLKSSQSIVEYEFDISSQIEGNKQKSSDNDILIKGFDEKNKNQVVEINSLFNSNSKDGNLYI